MDVLEQLKGLFAEDRPVAGNDRGTTDPSARSAGVQGREERGQDRARQPGVKARKGEGQTGDVVNVNLRLRRPIVEAVAAAVEASPIEFGNPTDFYRRAIEHELARRGLLKTYK